MVNILVGALRNPFSVCSVFLHKDHCSIDTYDDPGDHNDPDDPNEADDSRTTLGQLWDHCGRTLGSLWDHAFFSFFSFIPFFSWFPFVGTYLRSFSGYF